MQSWGVQSRFGVRDTGLEPSKSGVVGLLCAALGRRRDEPLEDLVALRMAVRVDREGILQRDFHTAKDVLKASGGIKDTEVSTRYYLADARFLVGLESGDLHLLQQLHAALRDPRWPLFLGRRAFVPGKPVWLADGLRPHEPLLGCLTAYPWVACKREAARRPDQLRLVVQDDEAGAEVRPDRPLSFAGRRFAPGRVRTSFIPAPAYQEDELCTCPD